MSEIEDLDLEFADPSEHAAVIEALWQEAALARRYGDLEPALDAYRHIIDIDPSHAEARLAAAETSRLAGRPREALRFCLDLLEQDRQHMPCRLELAEALRQLGQAAESHAVLDILLMERPDSIHVWCGVARLLADEGHLNSAETALRRALGLHRGHAPAWVALSRILARGGQEEEALDALHAACILEPEQPSHHVELAETLLDFGRPGEASGHVARALALDDEYAPAHMANARLLMLQGRLAESWEEAKWHHRLPGARRPLFPTAPWEGQDVEGKDLLLQADTGLSDTLMLARFVPILAGRGAFITLVIQRELVPLLASLPGVVRTLPLGEERPEDHAADFIAFLGDLPGLLGIELDSIPAAPYLRPPPKRIRRIRIPAGIQIKAGIAWSGESGQDQLPFAQVLALADVPGTLLFSLQTGKRAAEARMLADPGLITDLAPTVADCADLAGRIAEMDLVITTDGPAAHLAAAMGKPVLLLLSYAPHPRWMLGREDSPWYPGMALLRQPAPGQWEPVLAEARRRLEDLAREKGEENARQRQRATGNDAAFHAFLTAHAAPGDLLLDVGAGNGEFVFSAMEHCAGQLLILALEPSPTEAEILRDSLAVAGFEEQTEVITAAAGAAEGYVLASRQKRGGDRVFALPDWVPAATPILPLARLLDERPQLSTCRVLVRIGQSGWEAEIVTGLAGRAAVIFLEHHDGSAASAILAQDGYGLWRFPEDVAHGSLVPFDGAPGPVLALAPGLKPASHYGPTSLPPSPDLIAREEARAMSLAAAGPGLQTEGRVSEAADLYGQALAADPFCAMANANLAVLQHMAGKRAAAIAGFTRALKRSRQPAIMVNLAATLRRDGRFPEAGSLLEEAVAKEGWSPDLLHDMALLRRDQGRMSEAQALMRQACAMVPGRQALDWALAQILLGSGNLAEGLPMLAHRPAPQSRAPELPLWNGGDIVATSLLVEAHGDVIDTLLLARFLPPLAGRGALVTLACPDELAPLLTDLAGVELVIGGDDALPPCEVRTTLSTLPGLLGITDALGPARSGGYLVAGRGRRPSRDDRLRVGLTWGGRSVTSACRLGNLLALGENPTISLLALADDGDLEQIEQEGADCLVERPLPQPADLAEMATLISGLDVVVGAETIPLHLASALGKPVIALLPHGFNWRWPQGREDSPWYSSARVFRPDANGNWRATLRRVADTLAVMAEKKERD
jgi:tetratricopeptide (TPR) repeat protein